MGKAGDPDRSVELLWDGRAGLSLEAVVGAAVEVADAEGLAGLSMRKVAERLGFTTMSLYRHVPGREHLVDLMREVASGQVAEKTSVCRCDGWTAIRRSAAMAISRPPPSAAGWSPPTRCPRTPRR